VSEKANGNGSGVFGTIAGTVKRMTPDAVALVVINLVFVGGMFWLSEKQNASRERVLAPILLACANSVPFEALKYMAPPIHSPP
jgi:hypothetical protein